MNAVLEQTNKEIHETSELLGFKEPGELSDNAVWDALLEIREVVKRGKKPKLLCKMFDHKGPVLAQQIKGVVAAEVRTIGICKRCVTMYLSTYCVDA